MDFMLLLFLIPLCIISHPVTGWLLYAAPLLMALILRRRSVGQIVLLNILVGWFLPAWFFLLAWAIFGKSPERKPAEISD